MPKARASDRKSKDKPRKLLYETKKKVFTRMTHISYIKKKTKNIKANMKKVSGPNSITQHQHI